MYALSFVLQISSLSIILLKTQYVEALPQHAPTLLSLPAEIMCRIQEHLSPWDKCSMLFVGPPRAYPAEPGKHQRNIEQEFRDEMEHIRASRECYFLGQPAPKRPEQRLKNIPKDVIIPIALDHIVPTPGALDIEAQKQEVISPEVPLYDEWTLVLLYMRLLEVKQLSQTERRRLPDSLQLLRKRGQYKLYARIVLQNQGLFANILQSWTPPLRTHDYHFVSILTAAYDPNVAAMYKALTGREYLEKSTIGGVTTFDPIDSLSLPNLIDAQMVLKYLLPTKDRFKLDQSWIMLQVYLCMGHTAWEFVIRDWNFYKVARTLFRQRIAASMTRAVQQDRGVEKVVEILHFVYEEDIHSRIERGEEHNDRLDHQHPLLRAEHDKFQQCFPASWTNDLWFTNQLLKLPKAAENLSSGSVSYKWLAVKQRLVHLCLTLEREFSMGGENGALNGDVWTELLHRMDSAFDKANHYRSGVFMVAPVIRKSIPYPGGHSSVMGEERQAIWRAAFKSTTISPSEATGASARTKSSLSKPIAVAAAASVGLGVVMATGFVAQRELRTRLKSKPS